MNSKDLIAATAPEKTLEFKQRLLGEVEACLRTLPPIEALMQSEADALAWLGKAQGVIERWDRVHGVTAKAAEENIFNPAEYVPTATKGLRTLTVFLHQAEQTLRLETGGPVSMAIEQGRVFEYFEGLRKILQLATVDVLIVDPYLDADFISSYAPFIKTAVTLRLLSGDKKRYLATLLPAVKALAAQDNRHIEVRSSQDLHDRYVFIDGGKCYFSGASIKDGAKNAPTIISQIVDAFPTMRKTFEGLWASAIPVH